MKKPDQIIVSFSAGKDSLAVLDRCVEEGFRVHAFFMYWVKGICFQETTLEWAERNYGIKILRLPHFEVPRIMSDQLLTWYRAGTPAFTRIRMREVEDHARRKLTGDPRSWIASGEKKVDGMQRRGMLNARGPWDKRRLHYYPIQDWTDTQVWNYLSLRRVPIPLPYAVGMRRSWDSFRGPYLSEIKKHFPEDYRRILVVFPFVEAITRRYEFYGQNRATVEAPEVSRADREPKTAGRSAIQPTSD